MLPTVLTPRQDRKLNDQDVPQRTRFDGDVAAVTHGNLAADRSDSGVEFGPQPEGHVASAAKSRGKIGPAVVPHLP